MYYIIYMKRYKVYKDTRDDKLYTLLIVNNIKRLVAIPVTEAGEIVKPISHVLVPEEHRKYFRR